MLSVCQVKREVELLVGKKNEAQSGGRVARGLQHFDGRPYQ